MNPPHSIRSRNYELRRPADSSPQSAKQKRDKATASVDAWNDHYPEGTEVTCMSGAERNQRTILTKTTGKAYVLHGCTAVVPVECSASPWSLALVKPC